jgi:translocation-and-assembly-module (TAM) inner membrane subunit TamB-like protein
MHIARRLLHALIIVLTLLVGATAAVIIVTQTAWFKNWLRVYIEREANQYLNGQMSIGRLGGNLFYGVELENVAVSMDGSQVVAVKDLGLDYSIFELISKGLSLDNIRLNKPVIYLRREGDTWSISRLIKKQAQEADRQGPLKPMAIDEIGISDGSLVVDGPVGTSGVAVPKRIDHLDAKLAFKYEPVRYTIQITHVSFRGSEPAIGLNALSGGVSVRNDTLFVEKLALRTEETSLSVDGAVQNYLTKPVFKVQISSDKTSIPELARIVPALSGIRLQPAFELKLDGPADHLNVDARVRSSAGEMTGTLLTDVMAPGQSVTGSLSVRHVDLAPILGNRADKSDLTADARVDLRAQEFSNINSLRGTMVLNAPRVVFAGYAAEQVKANAHIQGRRVAVDGRAAAYGAAATASGRVTLPQGSGKGRDALAYDLHGRARDVDLRRLPRNLGFPPAATNVTADYHVSGVGPSSIKGDLRFEPSTVAGARIAGGSTAGFDKSGDAITYRADATVSDLDLARVGREFSVPALAADRYTSAINGHVVARGSGTTPAKMEVTASGTLTDSVLLGGRISNLAFDASLANDTAHVKADGAFAGFDPAVASGKPAVKGTVGGSLDVDATVAAVSKGVTPDTVEGTARINLQPSTIGGLAIDRAAIDADYRNSTGQIRTLDVAGRDLNVQASGTLALNDTGNSNLKLHADSPSLQQIGALAGQPLTGIGKVDGTVTGNRSNLKAVGNITGDGVKYGDNGALTLSSDYTVTIPDLRLADAQVSANTRGTFVSVAGQDINELTAKTTYENKQLTFDATATQPQRSLNAAGSLVFHPDHQEVHLQKLALQSQGSTWQIAPGAQPSINYANEAVAVSDLKLVNGAQQIGADGTLGRAGQAVKVTLTDVDLASVDQILLRPPQLSGRLNATSTIAGTKDAPNVKGEFEVSQGGFRQFHYDAFTGTIAYGGGGVTVDARLQQNRSAWITAKGYVPTAAFALSAASARPHHDAPAAADRIDLHVDSSPIDLGIVQGFTTQLTNVSGTVQAKIDVTGAADDPHPTGAITVQHAAFKVEPTGVAYTGLDGRIDLQEDRVHIGEIKVLDNQQKPLTLAGDLAVHELAVGTFNIAVKADDFKVLDNSMGNVRINSNLRLTGELANPRVEGDLGVTTGTVNLDPILEQTGDSAYATKQTEYASAASDTRGQTKSPSAYDALQVYVHVTVPDDLVLKGSELKTESAPIGLGALTVTIGGDVTVTKVPWDQIRLIGVVNTVRGTYTFQGRQFTILRDGTLRFEGLDEFDPALDIRTRRVIQAVDANVNLRGTLLKPVVELSSTPPLEQADILSLIVFNQPVNSLGEGQQASLAQRAEGIAAGAVAGELAKSIGNALNLNTFDIQMAPDSGATAQVTVGQQVGQNLFVKVQQDIGDQSATNFVFEYQLKEWLRLQSNLLQGSTTQQSLFRRAQGSGADLIFVFSY